MTRLWHDREALRDDGWSDAAVDSAVRHGRFVSVTKGALVHADQSHDVLARSAAALSTQRADAAVGDRTAAVLLGWPWAPSTWGLEGEPVDIIAARDDLTRSSRRGLRRRLAALPPPDVVDVNGLRVTSPARTAVDLARFGPRLIAVQLIDWLLTNEVCSEEDLRATISRMVRVPHVARARTALDLASEGVDSPPETTVRIQAVDAGLPRPDTCLRLYDGDGLLLARGDLGYWRWLIWIEYDSWQWHKERGVFAADRSRDRWLTRRGWEPMRLTDRDVHSPRNWLRQLEQSIAEAPARILAMDPRRSAEVAAAQARLTAASHQALRRRS